MNMVLQKRLRRNHMLLSVFLSSVYTHLSIVKRTLWLKEKSSDCWDQLIVEFYDENGEKILNKSNIIYLFMQ